MYICVCISDLLWAIVDLNDHNFYLNSALFHLVNQILQMRETFIVCVLDSIGNCRGWEERVTARVTQISTYYQHDSKWHWRGIDLLWVTRTLLDLNWLSNLVHWY
jgi:hypothetical protein